jgi:hypothetical protein
MVAGDDGDGPTGAGDDGDGPTGAGDVPAGDGEMSTDEQDAATSASIAAASRPVVRGEGT